MNPSGNGGGIAPRLALRAGADRLLTLEQFDGQPIVLALCGGAEEVGAALDERALEVVRAELRGLGAVLVVVSEAGVTCLGPEDGALRAGAGDARDAAERAAVRERFGVPPGATGIFVIDGSLHVRFAHVDDVPRKSALGAIAAALATAGHVDLAPLTLSRRELVVSSLAAALALALAPAPGMAAPAAARPAAPAPAELEITLHVNGAARRVRIDPRVTLLDALRERLGLTGTKKGCDQGQCGACTVLVDGRRVNACLTLAIMAQGLPIKTIEGLADENGLHPVQAAFIAHDGFQCGYCTAGQIMSAVGMLGEGHAHTDDEVREQMSGNICRCGAYCNIVAAIQAARQPRTAETAPKEP